jgi:hypothetical protein
MTNYRTPGVYIEEIRKFPPSVAQVETAIPAFIGYTERHFRNGESVRRRPTRITSMLEYEEFFGLPQAEEQVVVTINQTTNAQGQITKEIVTADFDFDAGGAPSRHVMNYCLQQYFENGGGPCYIVSVDTYRPFGEELSDQAAYLDALNRLREYDEPTLLVFPEGQGMGNSTYFAVAGAAMRQCFEMQDRFFIMDFHVSGREFNNSADFTDALQTFRDSINSPDSHLPYAAAYFPNIRSTFDYTVNEASIVIRHIRNGQPGDLDGSVFGDLDNSNQSKVKGAVRNMSIYLPPSASVAGVYARVDNSRGVWKAPANEGILAIDRLTAKVNDALQADFNVDVNAGRSVNVIREFAGKGIKIWGARTLAGNDNEWRYVSVRRYFNMVEESVRKATESFVFEPNDKNTWVRVRAMIENFLILQWRAGALAGAVPEHAFYVRVGLGETMTAIDILEGRMIVEIGMAVVRPAEFIILRFSHKMQES